MAEPTDIQNLEPYANQKSLSLQVAIGAADTTLQATSTLTGWPSNGYLLVDNEIMFYDAKDGAFLTGLARGADGTSAVSHEADATGYMVVNAAYHNLSREKLLATHSQLGLVPHKFVWAFPVYGTALREYYKVGPVPFNATITHVGAFSWTGGGGNLACDVGVALVQTPTTVSSIGKPTLASAMYNSIAVNKYVMEHIHLVSVSVASNPTLNAGLTAFIAGISWREVR